MYGANSVLLVGLTGGIGVGKSTVARVFACLGVPSYNADAMARYHMERNPQLYEAIVARFGEHAYINRKLNAPYVAERIFSDPAARTWINEKTHPIVHQDFLKWAHQHPVGSVPYVLYEAALLFETRRHTELNRTLLVVAPRKLRISRILARNAHKSKADIAAIIATQMPEKHKRALTRMTDVLQNDEKKTLISQVLKLHNSLIHHARG